MVTHIVWCIFQEASLVLIEESSGLRPVIHSDFSPNLHTKIHI